MPHYFWNEMRLCSGAAPRGCSGGQAGGELATIEVGNYLEVDPRPSERWNDDVQAVHDGLGGSGEPG